MSEQRAEDAFMECGGCGARYERARDVFGSEAWVANCKCDPEQPVAVVGNVRRAQPGKGWSKAERRRIEGAANRAN